MKFPNDFGPLQDSNNISKFSNQLHVFKIHYIGVNLSYVHFDIVINVEYECIVNVQQYCLSTSLYIGLFNANIVFPTGFLG